MKKRIQNIILLFFISSSFSGVEKVGPRLGRIVSSPTHRAYVLKKGNAQQQIPAIVTFDGRADFLSEFGSVRTVIGDIAVVDVFVDQIENLSNHPSVVYVESSVPAKPYLDKSLPLIKVPAARSNFSATGNGVLVGIIDSGIDFKHESFRKADGSTRIKSLLDLSETGNVYGGRVYDEDDINNALTGKLTISEKDHSGHGSHVAGIAAGDGTAETTPGKYSGVAPDAGLVIVKATRDELGSEFQTADQIVALKFIDSVATALGMPYVTNLSFGGHYGAHDGTSPVERVINQLVGAGIPGKAIVTVAGNDRDESVHAKETFSGSKTVAEITFEVENYSAQAGLKNDIIQLDGWYSGNKAVSVTLISPAGKTIGPIAKGSWKEENTTDGSIYIWNGLYESGAWLVPGVNPFNGDNEFFLQIDDAQVGRKPAEGTWTLRLAGTGGTVDVWKNSTTMPMSFVSGDVSSGKISVPGTSENAITVGSFVSKKQWEDVDGNNLTMDPDNLLQIGGISDFSSPGPTRDGRIKPDITAPGQIIASVLSQDALPSEPASIFASGSTQYPNAFVLSGWEYGLNNGTSMAGPHVAGVIALLLEKYPEASAAQLKDMLKESAAVDSKVGTAPNDDWGWGKVDAYAALQTIPREEEQPIKYKLLQVYPNPFTVKTTIEFEIPTALQGRTSLKIFNVLGQLVKELYSSSTASSGTKMYWDARDQLGYAVASGVYFIELNSGSHRETKKIVFVAPGSSN